MLYHIVYRDRLTGKTETGRVTIANQPGSNASHIRRIAIQTARFKYPAVKDSISAVAIRRPA